MARHNGYATFSACGTYRYELGGDIGPEEPLFRAAAQRPILWILINPSTADAQKDDRTIETVVRFSERWGYGLLMVGNLSAYCATDPDDMKRAQHQGVDVIGPENDRVLARLIFKALSSGGRVMAGWGKHGDPARARAVHAIAGEMYCLRTNKDGSPVHPLYQPGDLVPQLWIPPSA